jgi:hypothetical protein
MAGAARAAMAPVAMIAAATVGHAPATAIAGPRRPLPPVVPSPPDKRAAAISADSNFEWPRSGFRASVALGTAGQIGFGLEEASGAGGGFSLRLGTASGPRLAWLLELANTTYLAEDDLSKTQRNSSNLLVIGVQAHLTEVVWLRGGLGLARFTQPSEPTATNPPAGLGAVGGAGFDVVRRGSLALSVELALLSALYEGDQMVTGGFLGVGVTAY